MPLADVARLLGLAPSTLRHQIRKGKLRAEKRGRDWFVDYSEVERYRRESLRAAS
jgi:excisionase family DNA binding protein